MGSSCCIIYVFALLINEVSLEVTVKRFVGESAILQCLYTADKNLVQEVTWVHKEKNVYQIRPGDISQEQKYDTRAESFPQEYKEGKYSIKLNRLKMSDEGEYTCFITPAYHHEKIHLIVEEKPIIEEENQVTQIGPGIITLIVFVVIGACIVVFLLIMRKKKMSHV